MCAALQAFVLLRDSAHLQKIAEQALTDLVLEGRYERVNWCGCDIIFDVAHNAQASEMLVARLKSDGHTSVSLVMAIMKDKTLGDFISPLLSVVNGWFCSEVTNLDRSTSAECLAKDVRALTLGRSCRVESSQSLAESLVSAINYSKSINQQNPVVVVTGSFFTVAAVKNCMRPVS